MSKMGEFIAFNAAVELMKERGNEIVEKNYWTGAKNCSGTTNFIQKI